MPARFVVGVDLGTVNTALAAVDLAAGGDLVEGVQAWPVPQLVAPGVVAERRLLASAVYLPGPELPAPSRRLPWRCAPARQPGAPGPLDAPGPPGAPGEDDPVVGELARAQGAAVPGRVALSAKSWLAHPRADRTAPLLPWGAPEGVPRLSPVEAEARILGHLAAAWGAAHPDAPLGAQELVVAVPASFDAAARELTLRAAHEAGLPAVTLVEEPAAAFHDWAARHRGDLAAALPGGDALVLVVDVGGGTTDLTLVRATVRDGRPAFTRIAVGDHLLLGGDNMDLALARAAEARIAGEGGRLDAARFAALVLACREAKERLLAPGAPEQVPVAVAGRGSALVGGARSTFVGREEVRALVEDGFFPLAGPDERPRRAARTAGLAELGLPYEPDPAITRHVAAFLAAHGPEAGAPPGGLARPGALLVNGGVFAPASLRERLATAVSALFPGTAPIPLLPGTAGAALDLAVARGAALSALARRGVGQRIGGGSARAYYVGIATPQGERGLCLVPRHAEEGTRHEVPRPFALALDRPVRFPLFASARAALEAPGDLVPLGEDLVPLPPVEAVLRGEAAAPGASGRGAPAREVQVRLVALLSEIGTLDLWCEAAAPAGARWKLEFSLRAGSAGAEGGAGPAPVAAAPRGLAAAREQVEAFYGKRQANVDPKEVRNLFRTLERALGPRETWPTPLVRELWAALHAGRARRRRTADHERVWLQLTGFCLRPGFGAPLDGWRAAETWQVFAEGLQHRADPRSRAAWWILWRRIAGGLDAAAQERLLEAVAPLLRAPEEKRSPARAADARPEPLDEVVRLAGALERLPPARKVEVGEWLLARAARDGPRPELLWSVGRVGARVPFHASGHLAVPPEVATAWLDRLLASGAPPAALAFPVAQLARRSGDRTRDLAEPDRLRALAALERAGAPADLARAVREVALPDEAAEQRIFGESLPPGLRLVDDAPVEG